MALSRAPTDTSMWVSGDEADEGECNNPFDDLVLSPLPEIDAAAAAGFFTGQPKEAAIPNAEPLQAAALEEGVTIFLSSFGGHPHEQLSERVQGICKHVGIQMRVVDFVHSPELRKDVRLLVQLFAS